MLGNGHFPVITLYPFDRGGVTIRAEYVQLESSTRAPQMQIEIETPVMLVEARGVVIQLLAKLYHAGFEFKSCDHCESPSGSLLSTTSSMAACLCLLMTFNGIGASSGDG